MYATGYVLRETQTNLERKSPSHLPELEALFENVTVLDEPSARLVEQLAPLVPDPRDAPILAGVGEAQLLVPEGACPEGACPESWRVIDWRSG